MRHVVSIVVPTFKRKESLVRLLVSLARLHGNFDVIVVEQEASYGKTYKKLAKKHNIDLRYFFEKKRSTARAMNVGVSKARGKFVLFLDDDVVVRQGIIEKSLRNFSDPMVGAIVGRTLTEGRMIEPERRDTGRVNWLGLFSDGFSSTIRQEVDTVIGCNTCWRKSVYEYLGGIDEQFTGNALRLESDLSLRAKKAGYKIIFEPKAVVEHHRAETGGARKSEGRMEWYKDFFSNETYFFLKHKSKLLLPLFLLTKTNWALRCMFGFGREFSLRSLMTPALGLVDGIQKYKIFRTYDHRR